MTPHYAHGLVETPYVRVMGVVIEISGLLNTGGSAERVGKAVLSVKPRTEFDDTAFV